MTSHWCAIESRGLPRTILESYLRLNNIMTLKSRLGVTQGHWKWHHSIDHTRVAIRLPLVLLVFHCNYGPILYHFRDKAKYWGKLPLFSYPSCTLLHC